MQFQEKQHLNLWWLYMLIGIDAIMVTTIVLYDKGGMALQDLKAIYFLPVWAVLLPFAIVLFVQRSTLTLNISNNGISYRYYPFSWKFRNIRWDAIESVYITKIDAFGDYGGFGVKNRLWFKFKDKAYILNDKTKGLQFKFKDGKMLLFTTNKLEEMEQFLIHLKMRYQIKAIQ